MMPRSRVDAIEETREDGQQVRAGLSGAALGDTDQIVALQDDRDGLALDGRRLGETGSADPLRMGVGSPNEAKVTDPPMDSE